MESVPTPQVPALVASDLNTTINHQPRIMDLRLAEALGFDRPRNVRRLVERHREALERFGEVCSTVEQTSERGGRPGRAFWLTRKQAIYLCAKSETERATDITIQVVEVFDAVTGGASVVPPPRAPRRPPVPRAISRDTLEVYASWLWGERVRVLAELYPDREPGHRTGVMVNAGSAYHAPRSTEVQAPPSTRAEAVLQIVGCRTPKPPSPHRN